MPFRYNTFDGRLLWFDGVEGKRGLTLTGFVFVVVVLFVCFRGGGGGAEREGEGQTVSLVRTGVYGILCA